MGKKLESVEPGSRNRVNWMFGSFLLAVKDEALEVQSTALAFFHRISTGITRSRGWFHPRGVEEWDSITNAALVEQLRKFGNWSTVEIQENRAGNSFAYVYNAIKNRFIDELRKMLSHPCEVAMPLDDAPFSALRDPAPHPDQSLQRDGVLRLMQAGQLDFREDRALAEILLEARRILKDPGSVTAPTYRAEIVNRIARTLCVTRQQGRYHVRRFEDLAHTDATLRAIIREVGGLPSLGEHPILGFRDGRREPEPGMEASE